nr:protein FAR1-related sequence 5-like [Tanacetum cinerariifolium]
MKFVPFIGIDNHEKCVTLGSGMLLHEDTKSYTWLLNAFMIAFSHEPIMIVTDQDGAMKRVIEAVFKKAKHRLCMWHIMQKIPSKTESHEIHSDSHDIQSESYEIRQNLMTYNFSRFILDGMIGNIWSKRHKFLMYPRFLQMILGIQTTDPSPRPTFDFTAKLFSNMKLNWDGPHMPLLAPMLVVPTGGDGADAAAAGAPTAHKVPPPPPPPAVPPTHSSSSTPGPSTAAQDTPVKDPTLVKEPTPSPMREPTTLRETTHEPPRPPSPPPCTKSEEVGPTTSTAGNDSILIEDPLRPIEPWPTSPTTPFNTTTSTRPPSPTRQTSFQEDISEGGGDYVSSPKSNEAPPSTAATATDGAEDSAALTDLSLKLDRCINRVTTLENELGVTKNVFGGAILKLVSRVKRLEGLIQQRKRRMVLFDSEGEEAATKEKDIDLDALYKLASTRTRTKRRRLRKTFTSSAFEHFQENISTVEDAISAGDGIPADAQTIHAGSTPIPTTGGVSAGSSMDPAGQAAAAAPSSSAIPAANKGKAPMVDDSIPADPLTEQERVLKNLHDYQLGEDLAKKLQAEQEAEFARQQEELAQKAQAESVASPAAQGDDVNEDNMNERLGMLLMRKMRELAEQSWVKALSIAQLKHEFEYIQRNLERSNLLNFKRTTFRPKPTLEAPSAKKARQGVPLAVHAASSQVPAGVPAAPSIAADVLVSVVSTTTTDDSVAPTTTTSIAGGPSPSVAENPTTPTQVHPVTPDLAAVAAHVDTEVHADESRSNDNKTASEQVSAEHTVDETTPLSSRKRHKQLAKKRVTPIVDVADDALIKFDSASESDDDPSRYAPYASWEMVPTLFGSIHAYYYMEEHTKHFTSLRELLHMVEKNDLRRLMGDVDNFYQAQEPETFALILGGICAWRLYPRPHVHVLETVDGRVIYMFVDVSYPLSEATLKRMPQHGLEVPKLLVRGDLTMAEQLVIQNWMVITFYVSFWNEKWLVQGGMALELASPEQTATGKDVSNPFMAVMGRIVGNYKISLRVVSAVSYSSCWQGNQDDDKDIVMPEAGFNFCGIISSCFEPHLMVYVEFEEKTLMDNLEKLINEETWEPLVGDDSMTTHPLTRVRVNAMLLEVCLLDKYEIKRLTALLHSKTTTSDVGEGDQANISNDSHVEEMENFHVVISTHVVNSRAFEEDVASPAELAKAYMDASTRPAKVSPSTLRHGIQAPRQDSVLLNNITILLRTHVTSLVPRTAGSLKGDENGTDFCPLSMDIFLHDTVVSCHAIGSSGLRRFFR